MITTVSSSSTPPAPPPPLARCFSRRLPPCRWGGCPWRMAFSSSQKGHVRYVSEYSSPHVWQTRLLIIFSSSLGCRFSLYMIPVFCRRVNRHFTNSTKCAGKMFRQNSRPIRRRPLRRRTPPPFPLRRRRPRRRIPRRRTAPPRPSARCPTPWAFFSGPSSAPPWPACKPPCRSGPDTAGPWAGPCPPS